MVWEALPKSPLLEQDKDFVRVTLWHKQPVGIRQQEWKPRHTQCLVDGKPETNITELLAIVTALRLHADHPKVAICANSAYVLLGVKGAAKRRKINGWKGSSGTVSNAPLWDDMLQFSDDTFQDLRWVKVPSHVNVMANEETNTAAN